MMWVGLLRISLIDRPLALALPPFFSAAFRAGAAAAKPEGGGPKAPSWNRSVRLLPARQGSRLLRGWSSRALRGAPSTRPEGHRAFSSSQPSGTTWPDAFTSTTLQARSARHNSTMICMESRDAMWGSSNATLIVMIAGLVLLPSMVLALPLSLVGAV
ncbi:hypothetical protein V8C86DRAFT_2509625 [Haematococcus lacustris]